MNFYPEVTGFEMVDRMMFLDLLQKIFVFNPEERITPEEALTHPFICMSHVSEAFKYAADSARIMKFTPNVDSDEELEDKNVDMLDVDMLDVDMLDVDMQDDLNSGSQSLVEVPHHTSEDEGRQDGIIDVIFLDDLFKKGDSEDITQMLNFLEMPSVDPPIPESNYRILSKGADEKMIICLSPPLRNSLENPVLQPEDVRWRRESVDTEGSHMMPKMESRTINIFKKGETATCEARSRLPVIDFAEPSPNSARALENAEEVIRQQPLPFANTMEEQALDDHEEENSLWFPALIQPVLNYIRPFTQCFGF
ncbi:hypothetical protein WMY93_004676 [Mugilogobius chulae]|uniref:Protein kinase domain-containing protein n=1 Tax=Mugilogobius chulae TaxID=88201 RepID=A0AAW0PVF2_9GOBI